MRLNFYYEFPEPEGSIYSEYTHLISSQRLYERFVKDNPNWEVNRINSWYLDYTGKPGEKPIHCPSCKYSHFFLIIENADNGKYFLISYWDKFKDIYESNTYWDLENCVEKFAAVGVHKDDFTYEWCGKDYTPISYMPLYKSAEKRIEEVYKLPKIMPEKPYFRGFLYYFRKYLKHDHRFIIEGEKIDAKTFIDEIAGNAINIDLPSVAEISGRTSDILGLQSCVIRPKFTLKFHNPLIPNYHYAQVECENFSDWPKLADAYIDKFEEMKNKPEEAEFIAKNGRLWYEQNCTVDAHVNILYSLIDINKLS
jgi:hypothetical protein